MRSKGSYWHGSCSIAFVKNQQFSEISKPVTTFQGQSRAPFKLMRSSKDVDGRCEIPVLHTAGGLVGGDKLTINVKAMPGSKALITTVAAQKVYGSVGLSHLQPEGIWAKQ